jgi:hypothetical protein
MDEAPLSLPTWLVYLTGDSVDLEMLALSCVGPSFNISKVGKDYALACSEFESIGNAQDVRARALALLDRLNGASRLVLESRVAIGVARLRRHDADGRITDIVCPEPAIATVRALPPSVKITADNGSEVTHHPADPVHDWILLSASDPAVARLLTLVGTEPMDWVNLYRIFEVVCENSGGMKSIEAKGWATDKAMRLFKWTANCPDAIGTKARHGVGDQAPQKPMSLTEARGLIGGIVKAWLMSKVP